MCRKKKNMKKRKKKKSPSHGYCETVLCHFVMCPFVYDPSLKDATSPTTHPYFVPCPPHPGVISPGHQHCLGRAHSLPQPAHSSYPSIRLIMWESAGGWEVAEEWGSSWGHWNQVLLWIVIVFALFSPSDCISIYTIYLYNKTQCQSFLMQGIFPTLQKKNLMDF